MGGLVVARLPAARSPVGFDDVVLDDGGQKRRGESEESIANYRLTPKDLSQACGG
jgi:hypothetical protein